MVELSVVLVEEKEPPRRQTHIRNALIPMDELWKSTEFLKLAFLFKEGFRA